MNCLVKELCLQKLSILFLLVLSYGRLNYGTSKLKNLKSVFGYQLLATSALACKS